jgi:hypothetical protein
VLTQGATLETKLSSPFTMTIVPTE